MNGTELGRLLTGRYRLSAVIGRGGMGVVWRAHDELLKRDVAVKEIVWPPHFSEQEQQTACRRAIREAQVAARLNHLNVVRIYDIVEEDGHPWIIMELLPYRSLRDIVREDGPLAPVQAARVGLGILAALRAAHGEGVLHRDVKPANILIGTDGRVVLTDFGIARATDSPTLTTAGVLVGSPSYIAPERARGGPSGTPADLWGLGASLYAAVEGRPPFERDNPLATLTAVVADEPEPPAHAGPLGPVISGLLRKDPDERLGVGDAERRLSQVAGNGAVNGGAGHGGDGGAKPIAPEPPPARAPEPEPKPAGPDTSPPRRSAAAVPRPGRRRARNRAAVLGVLAGLAVAVTAIAFVLTSSPRHQAASQATSSRPGARPSVGASNGSQPASSASAQASSGTGASGTPGTSSPSGSAGAGSSGRSGTGTAGPGALPAGYYRFTNSTGFSIGVPQGWVISHAGHYVYLTDPANSGIFLLIDQSDNPQPNPLADWEQQAAARASGYPGYHLIKLASVRYPQAEAAADWEFTYDRNGVLVHILNRNVLANARHAYALYWSTPASDWTADYHYFQVFAASFRPAPA